MPEGAERGCPPALRLQLHVLLGALILAAGLESGLGLCLGCKLFAWLMRAGAIPAEVCERCAPLDRQAFAAGD